MGDENKEYLVRLDGLEKEPGYFYWVGSKDGKMWVGRSRMAKGRTGKSGVVKWAV